MDIREDREPHIATERARSISGSQHEMGIFTRPWRRPWRPGVRLTLFKVNMSKDRGSRTMAPRIDAKPRRFRLNRTRRGLSTAEIVSQSAGRDGSKIENGKRSNLFPFELLTRRAAGAELVFNSHLTSARPPPNDEVQDARPEAGRQLFIDFSPCWSRRIPGGSTLSDSFETGGSHIQFFLVPSVVRRGRDDFPQARASGSGPCLGTPGGMGRNR